VIGVGSLVCVVVVVRLCGIKRTAWWVLGAFSVLGAIAGLLVAARVATLDTAGLPKGTVDAVVRVAEDPSGRTFGTAVGTIEGLSGVAWDGPRVGLIGLPPQHTVGATVAVVGDLRPGVRRVGDERVAGILRIHEVTSAVPSSNPLVRVGNGVRSSVGDRYDGSHRQDGLLSGFLTGDTDLMAASDEESLRLAGLSHFVAVSGSNVALFLAIWWLVTAPLSIHRRLRLVLGGVGLVLFAVVTRWEPSVVRACVMAGVVLAGGSLGVPVDPWMGLAVAVTVVLLVSAQLAFSVGFQLSVLATAGVLIGLGLAQGRRPRWLFVPLFSTLGAQIAVAPLLLVVFGSVPLLGPATNLIVGPVIAATTVTAAIGVLVPVAAVVARMGATVVLDVATFASFGPQLGWVGSGVWCAVALGLSIQVLRAPTLALGAVALAVAVPWVAVSPTVPTLTVLDIGQGDAILIQDPGGSTMLMDGGSDPAVLDRALRRHGLRSVDVVVVSHEDLDHVGGLVDLVRSGRTGVLVVSEFLGPTEVLQAATEAGVPIRRVAAGDRFSVGSVAIEVLSPARRFLSDNDGSITLMVSGRTSVMLPGDIEAVAQRELPDVQPDVLVVPHHGSATTDLRWLSDTLGSVAVLSYGPNRYGHPHPDVIAVLDASGVTVFRTVDGDVAIDLSASIAHVTVNR
jgi:competence protein ComEC